jgi:hypothetical protein
MVLGVLFMIGLKVICVTDISILAWEELTQIFLVIDLEYRKDQF